MSGPDLAADLRFATNPARVTHREVLLPMIAAATATWTCAALFAALEENGIPAGPVNQIDQVFADPQVVARGMRLSINTADGELPGLAAPLILDGTRMIAPRASPRLGEHAGAAWQQPERKP